MQVSISQGDSAGGSPSQELIFLSTKLIRVSKLAIWMMTIIPAIWMLTIILGLSYLPKATITVFLLTTAMQLIMPQGNHHDFPCDTTMRLMSAHATARTAPHDGVAEVDFPSSL